MISIYEPSISSLTCVSPIFSLFLSPLSLSKSLPLKLRTRAFKGGHARRRATATNRFTIAQAYLSKCIARSDSLLRIVCMCALTGTTAMVPLGLTLVRRYPPTRMWTLREDRHLRRSEPSLRAIRDVSSIPHFAMSYFKFD